jgi:Lipocalin-like domain
MPTNPLVGAWRLISWKNTTADGDVSHPLGKDASGYIAYNDDGYVFVAIMRPTRTHFVAGDLLSGSREEKAAAAETYVSYCGRYELQGDTVVHHVELSLFPNWVGVDQERLVNVNGDRLTLSTRPLLLDGRQQTAHLVWERIRGSALSRYAYR